MKKLEKPILANGETTGHAHRIDGAVDVFECEDGTRQFENRQPVMVVHEEHNPVEVPTGKHESGIVQEYDHFAEEARRVQD